MPDIYIAEIKIFPYGYTPMHFAVCNGQYISKNDHEDLYNIIGHKYSKKNDEIEFNLPDLIDRAPINFSEKIPLGKKSGEKHFHINNENTPTHNHLINVYEGKSFLNTNALSHATDPKTKPSVLGYLVHGTSAALGATAYGTPTDEKLKDIQSDIIVEFKDSKKPEGSEDPKEFSNRQPYLALNFCIALASGTHMVPKRH